MRLAAEKGNLQGTLENLKLAAAVAIEEKGEEAFKRVTVTTLLNILQTEASIKRLMLKMSETDTEDTDAFWERLGKEKGESTDE
jgi:hypothetical protein